MVTTRYPRRLYQISCWNTRCFVMLVRKAPTVFQVSIRFQCLKSVKNRCEGECFLLKRHGNRNHPSSHLFFKKASYHFFNDKDSETYLKAEQLKAKLDFQKLREENSRKWRSKNINFLYRKWLQVRVSFTHVKRQWMQFSSKKCVSFQ